MRFLYDCLGKGRPRGPNQEQEEGGKNHPDGRGGNPYDKRRLSGTHHGDQPEDGFVTGSSAAKTMGANPASRAAE